MVSKRSLKLFLKQVLLVLAAVFLLFQSYGLLSGIHHFSGIAFAPALFLPWVINMFITGIFAFAGFALPTQYLLLESYYTISNPDRLEQIYRGLRVDWFRKALLATLWRSQAQRKKYFNGKVAGLEHLNTQSRKAEFGHLVPFVILSFISVYLVFFVQPVLGLLCLGINLAGNFYPVVLQRHHRMRLQRISRIQQYRTTAEA